MFGVSAIPVSAIHHDLGGGVLLTLEVVNGGGRRVLLAAEPEDTGVGFPGRPDVPGLDE